ncbi:MAG TPA: hypothetical protein PLD47_16785 [Aggregatilineales bacterium]|nr:hypothetical protein [Anaerolineales bacterium]HRE49383.1 hypothetical protein [Aggregatilineales bacterium]
MSLAQVRVEAGQIFTIDNVVYRVASHPALPGLPYVQRGARGFVIQLRRSGDNERTALKYFKLKYRVPNLVAITEALRRYADLPGLRAARRTIFTRTGYPGLLDTYPALEYGVLMPWLPGVTWYDIVSRKEALSKDAALRLGRGVAYVLSSLEGHGLAHGDIAGANVIVDKQSGGIELVDIEELYGADLPRPVEAPGGQDGYQHHDGRSGGQWRPEGDRFGAAVLISEMLGWAVPRIRQNSADEHYFAASEMGAPDSLRFRLLAEALHAEYGAAVAELFRTAWGSPTLAACPPLAAWKAALESLQEGVEGKLPTAALTSPANQESPPPTTSPTLDAVITRRREIKVQIPLTQFREGETASPPPLEASLTPAPTTSAPPPAERLNLEGKKLCRNCGAANNAGESFCARCGFYIGTGMRKAIPYTHRGASQTGGKTTVPANQAPSPPRPITINRNLDQIISGRRIGADGRRVEMNQPNESPIEGNFGQYIVLALIIGAVLTILLLAVGAR